MQSFSPTVPFIALVPRVLAIYQVSAACFNAWENRAHQSTRAASLALKTFAPTAVVAYPGLALSAFVYVPFGDGIMHAVQRWLNGSHDLRTVGNMFVNSTVGPAPRRKPDEPKNGV